jgi:hypothetical protein
MLPIRGKAEVFFHPKNPANPLLPEFAVASNNSGDSQKASDLHSRWLIIAV